MSLPFETYHGYVRTPLDAIYLFEACRTGRLPRVQRRLSEKERQLIKAGSIFVWDEQEAGMRRWTDGKAWSASRVSGSFLTYREMEGKKAISSSTGNNSDDESNSESGIISIANDGFKYKANGLMKQSFSITTTTGLRLHLISYYPRSHANLSKLKQPSLDPMLKDIVIPPGLYPDNIDNPHGIPMTNNNQQSTIQPSRPQLPMSNQYFNHPQQVPMIPTAPPPPPPPPHMHNPYPPPPPPIQTHPHLQMNPHLQYNQPPPQYYPPYPQPQQQQPIPPQSVAPSQHPRHQQQQQQQHAPPPPPPPQPYMYRNNYPYPTPVPSNVGALPPPPPPPPQNAATPVMQPPMPHNGASAPMPPHMIPYQEPAYSPSIPQTQSPIPPPIQYSKRPSIQSPEIKREPSVSYPTPTPTIIHTNSQPPTPIDTKANINRSRPRMMSLSTGSNRISKSPITSKSSRVALPKHDNLIKFVSPIQQSAVVPSVAQMPQLQPPIMPSSPRQSVFSNNKLPLPSFTNKDGTLTLPSLSNLTSSHSNSDKPMWREDIRAIQVLDKGFI